MGLELTTPRSSVAHSTELGRCTYSVTYGKVVTGALEGTFGVLEAISVTTLASRL